MLKPLDLTVVDENGSGLEFPASFLPMEVVGVMDLTNIPENVQIEGARSAVMLRSKDKPALVKETRAEVVKRLGWTP